MRYCTTPRPRITAPNDLSQFLALHLFGLAWYTDAEDREELRGQIRMLRMGDSAFQNTLHVRAVQGSMTPLFCL